MSATEIQQALAAEEKLAGALGAFTGQWVAVSEHRVVDHADTLAALLERVEPNLNSIERIFEVADPGGICFL
jgi:Family of unknown function (DUF5678)